MTETNTLSFNITMDPSNDLPSLAKCTTCRFKEDLSNYWTAVMYFKHPNGSYTRVCSCLLIRRKLPPHHAAPGQVPQIANQVVGSPNGGMTVYYVQPPNNQKVTSFKKVTFLWLKVVPF